MEIYKAKDKKDFLFLGSLLESYIVELNSISDTVKIRPQKVLEKEYFNIPDTDYFLIKEGYSFVGFAIIGQKSNCPKGTDKFICEFYIVPQFRQKKYGSILIEKILEKSNSVCFCILKNNEIAKKFWFKIFENWQIRETTDDYDVIFYTFDKKNDD